ncbi:hypothetical protein PMIN03_006358 [Paraphaeosphaeria minitans]
MRRTRGMSPQRPQLGSSAESTCRQHRSRHRERDYPGHLTASFLATPVSYMTCVFVCSILTTALTASARILPLHQRLPVPFLAMSSPKRRIETDVGHLSQVLPGQDVCIADDSSSLRAGHEVGCHGFEEMPTHADMLLGSNNLSVQEFYVRFKGPVETPFEGGLWKIHVELPDQYPYKSPSIGFVNRIFHPNIDELSGSVCLDVINQTWSPMYDMINIFEVFLPQLLRYPNPTDPLNGEAAALLMREPKSYDAKVKEYVQKYASKDTSEDSDKDNDDDDEMSSVGSYESGDDDEAAGNMEDI